MLLIYGGEHGRGSLKSAVDIYDKSLFVAELDAFTNDASKLGDSEVSRHQVLGTVNIGQLRRRRLLHNHWNLVWVRLSHNTKLLDTILYNKKDSGK